MNGKIEVAGIEETQDYFRKAFEQTLARLKIKDITKILRSNESSSKDSVIVSVGDQATRQVTSDPSIKVKDDHSYVLQCSTQLVVPCLDYKETFKDGLNTHWLEWSLRKAKNLATDAAAYLTPQPHAIIRPELSLVSQFIDTLLWTNDAVSIDIECVPETCEITCIAFAASPDYVISIPFANSHLSNYWSQEEEVFVWGLVQKVLASNKLKIFQNFIFDTMVLRYHGMETVGPFADTMIVASALNPLLPKGLKDLGRIYLYCEPWKDNKDFKLTGDVDDFWKYNALDAARTFTVYKKQLLELESTGKKEHYEKFIAPLIPLVYDLCVRGHRIDAAFLATLNQSLDTELEPIIRELRSIGDPLVETKKIKKTLRDKPNDKDGVKAFKEVIEEVQQDFNPNSDKQIKSVLKGLGFRIPIKYGKESTNRESLLKLNRKQSHPFIANLLQYSRLAKLKSTYASLLLDEDARCRFFYNIAGTISGRFSSQKTVWGTGLNIVTIPRTGSESALNVKNLFIPDEGKTFIEVDLSQAELRVVAWLANETKLIELFERKEDVHQYTADRIRESTGLNCPRQLGKRINHASSYGMGAEKFSDSCLTEADISINVADARKLLEARSKTFPAISIWQRSIEAQLGRTRKLTSPFGRSAFFYGPLSDDMVRQGLSFIPQATVVDVVNQAWIRMSQSIGYNKYFNVMAQVHDSLLIAVESDKIDLMLRLIRQSFSDQGLIINGVSREIPIDVSTGQSWGSMKEIECP